MTYIIKKQFKWSNIWKSYNLHVKNVKKDHLFKQKQPPPCQKPLPKRRWAVAYVYGHCQNGNGRWLLLVTVSFFPFQIEIQ